MSTTLKTSSTPREGLSPVLNNGARFGYREHTRTEHEIAALDLALAKIARENQTMLDIYNRALLREDLLIPHEGYPFGLSLDEQVMEPAYVMASTRSVSLVARALREAGVPCVQSFQRPSDGPMFDATDVRGFTYRFDPYGRLLGELGNDRVPRIDPDDGFTDTWGTSVLALLDGCEDAGETVSLGNLISTLIDLFVVHNRACVAR